MVYGTSSLRKLAKQKAMRDLLPAQIVHDSNTPQNVNISKIEQNIEYKIEWDFALEGSRSEHLQRKRSQSL